MTTATAVCSSIEGEKIALKTRKFTPQLPRRDATMGHVFCFKLGINSEAHVTEAYAPGKPLHRPKASFLTVGDALWAMTIDGFAKKPIGPPEVKKGSGAHKASFISLRGGAYAHIEGAVRELLQRDDKKLR